MDHATQSSHRRVAAGGAVTEPPLIPALVGGGQSGGQATLLGKHLLALGQLGQAGAEDRASLLHLGLEVDQRPQDLLDLADNGSLGIERQLA